VGSFTTGATPVGNGEVGGKQLTVDDKGVTLAISGYIHSNILSRGHLHVATTPTIWHGVHTSGNTCPLLHALSSFDPQHLLHPLKLSSPISCGIEAERSGFSEPCKDAEHRHAGA